ncbi:putative hydroxypyruvate isomerase isoform X1 [Neodiprion fabricii]|uniref:putative hydroxypyruvate isomerase isoform X1 n=2 Tax=Neodiprion fabricii TaxID=2872261 RepID=UPI001ED97B8F|nr:putative hydroxypyruvate isomerase isoform X1 [Neodiprion fabricii]
MSLGEFSKKVVKKNCRRKGTIIRSKEREVIKSIIEFCDQEARQKSLLFPLRQATKRAANYTKISERTVKRIREENKLGLEFADDDDYSTRKWSRGPTVTMKFASNLSFMFGESPKITERYQLAKQAGFKAVETGFPLGFTAQEVADARSKADVKQVLINIFTGDVSKGEMGFAAIPGKEDEFKKSVALTIEYAKALDCKKIHVMSGKVESPNEINDSTYESNMRFAIEKFQAEDIVALIEPINSITMPNYYMNSFEKGLEIVKKINSPHLRLMLDLFHLQHARGNITRTIKEYLPYLGHVQVAQVPDRHEPDTAGELNYRYVFSLLEKEGYKDYIGLEYRPKAGSAEGLKWIKNFGYTL